MYARKGEEEEGTIALVCPMQFVAPPCSFFFSSSSMRAPTLPPPRPSVPEMESYLLPRLIRLFRTNSPSNNCGNVFYIRTCLDLIKLLLEESLKYKVCKSSSRLRGIFPPAAVFADMLQRRRRRRLERLDWQWEGGGGR